MPVYCIKIKSELLDWSLRSCLLFTIIFSLTFRVFILILFIRFSFLLLVVFSSLWYVLYNAAFWCMLVLQKTKNPFILSAICITQKNIMSHLVKSHFSYQSVPKKTLSYIYSVFIIHIPKTIPHLSICIFQSYCSVIV